MCQRLAHVSVDARGGAAANGASSLQRSLPSARWRAAVPELDLLGSCREALLVTTQCLRHGVWQQRTPTKSSLKLSSSLNTCCSHPAQLRFYARRESSRVPSVERTHMMPTLR
jgi:hypothetical protein